MGGSVVKVVDLRPQTLTPQIAEGGIVHKHPLGNNHFLICGGEGWDFHCFLKKKFQNLPQSKYFFLMRKKAKNVFPIRWNRGTFIHKKKF